MNVRRLNQHGHMLIFLIAMVLVVGIGTYLLIRTRDTQAPASVTRIAKDEQTDANTNQETGPVPAGVAGYIGGSLTNNAVEGYGLLGGTRFWATKSGNFGGYGGGTIEKWADGINPGSENANYWKAFDQAYENSKSRGPTAVFWIQLLGRGEPTDEEYYTSAVKVIDEVHRRIPEAIIYISAMNGYDPPGACNGVEATAPNRMQALTERLVKDGKARLGPTIGTITAAQVNDGDCHANTEGKKVEGKPLLDFFGK